MQAAAVSRIAPADAAQALAGLHHLDPRRMTGPADVLTMCQRGDCWALDVPGGRAVYVTRLIGGGVWIDAASGSAPGIDLAGLLDGVIAAQAQGATHLAMQTARPGLVRKLARRGWRVSGWIMTKDLPQ